MSGYSRSRLGSPSIQNRPILRKLHFTSSDGEDEPIEDVNSSTGTESGFADMDSPVLLRRHAADKRLDGGSSPLNQSGDDAELWDEDGFGSPSHLRPRNRPLFANCTPSPRKSPRLYSGSPERSYVQDDGEGSSSPIPDCPDTPPHKTFRKLRLFDTPHTPKVNVWIRSQHNCFLVCACLFQSMTKCTYCMTRVFCSQSDTHTLR